MASSGTNSFQQIEALRLDSLRVGKHHNMSICSGVGPKSWNVCLKGVQHPEMYAVPKRVIICFPTDQDLADILGMTDFSFWILVLLDYQISRQRRRRHSPTNSQMPIWPLSQCTQGSMRCKEPLLQKRITGNEKSQNRFTAGWEDGWVSSLFWFVVFARTISNLYL